LRDRTRRTSFQADSPAELGTRDCIRIVNVRAASKTAVAIVERRRAAINLSLAAAMQPRIRAAVIVGDPIAPADRQFPKSRCDSRGFRARADDDSYAGDIVVSRWLSALPDQDGKTFEFNYRRVDVRASGSRRCCLCCAGLFLCHSPDERLPEPRFRKTTRREEFDPRVIIRATLDASGSRRGTETICPDTPLAD